MSTRDPRRTIAARLRAVETLNGTFEPGDVRLMVDEPGGPTTGYGFGCPGCGDTCILHLGTGPEKHTWNVTAGDASKPETVTLSPSIHHVVEHGGCGWHGYLTRGVFTPC